MLQDDGTVSAAASSKRRSRSPSQAAVLVIHVPPVVSETIPSRGRLLHKSLDHRQSGLPLLCHLNHPIPQLFSLGLIQKHYKLCVTMAVSGPETAEKPPSTVPPPQQVEGSTPNAQLEARNRKRIRQAESPTPESQSKSKRQRLESSSRTSHIVISSRIR